MKQSDKSKITYDRIIEAAIKEFGINGYDGASLNHICDTGISKGLIYHNFENKDAIYLACVECCFNTFTDFLKSLAIRADLQLYMNARLRFFSENADLGKIFFEAVLKPPKHLQSQISNARKRFDDLNHKLYQSMLDCIVLRTGVTEEDAMDYFTLMQTMFNGYFSSPAFRKIPFCEIIACHENKLSKLLEFMLYGIAEREAL